MTRLITNVALTLGVTLGLPIHGQAQSPSTPSAPSQADVAAFPPGFVGRWRATPFETPLDTDYDREIYGPRAVAVRTTDLTIARSGEATLVVTRYVRNAAGATVPGTRSIDTVTFKVVPAASLAGEDTNAHYVGSIGRADRTYPGQAVARTRLREVRVELVAADDRGRALELTFDSADAGVDGGAAVTETLTRAAAVRAAAR